VYPYVRHIDHTEHDIKCVVTEQGYALIFHQVAAPRRGHHREVRHLLREILHVPQDGGTATSRTTDMTSLHPGKDYDALGLPAKRAVA